MQEALSALIEAVQATHPGQILIVTGAGVSHASGIPTFRGTDKDAIWKRDVMELGTYRFFRENPAGSWQWYLSRFAKLEGARPNPGHLAITALERFQLARGGDFLLVTQNIDTLHEQAGTQRMIKVHGSSDRFRCSVPDCSLGEPEGSIAASEVDLTAFRKEPVEANVPRCPACGGFLRMHVLWFDEYYAEHRDYGWHAACRAAEQEARLVIFAGTSFAVGVTDMVLRAARMRDVPVFNIDPTPRISDDDVTSIAAGAEVALVEVCKALGVAV
ncbi:SIR2 family NAD-dependent protein deacylase [Hyalangium gracile]|uniref:SIR2 family NAD-dependent protein deacylase n=1 Tax=Hyalangium gracile TaxID=394092 RepID=UPI001CC9ED33|nr:Sir2 family NAD-dependent protein deacetylase [Hyalangium gracile]